jgi:acyl-CoA thioester hydrolase
MGDRGDFAWLWDHGLTPQTAGWILAAVTGKMSLTSLLLNLEWHVTTWGALMESDGWHQTKIRVRYKDTDRLGVVYYGNYLTYFEVGRAEIMRDLGFSYSTLEAEGHSLVVTEAFAKYHGNVGYDATVTVKTKISEIRGARIRFDYEVLGDSGKLLVSGYTVHGCINARSRPSRIPSSLVIAIEEKLGPVTAGRKSGATASAGEITSF